MPTRAYKRLPLGPSDEDRLRWARFLAELPERIERIRAEEAPCLCPTCGSTTPAVVERKWCPGCRRERRADEFNRNGARYDGLASICRECKRKADKLQRTRRAIRNLALGRRAAS